MKGQVARVAETARTVLALDRSGRPRWKNSGEIFAAIRALRRTGEQDLVRELVEEGFCAGAEERYARHIAPRMRAVPATRFEMGTNPGEVRFFCGESPRHPVELSPFAISRHPVTNGLYDMFDDGHDDAGCDLPVVAVTWFDAAVFALWVGCRLPSEAQWEYACGAGGAAQWCCSEERDLPRHAWYSENAGDRPHPVGTREPNALGLFDMHGNVWEWCADDYDADYFRQAPPRDPVNDASATRDGTDAEVHKVARGGGFYALAEMCRTRYRLHDPAGYWASDLGFRLVRDSTPGK